MSKTFDPLSRKKICLVATVAMPLLVFMKPHILRLKRDYDIVLVANAAPEDLSSLLGEGVRFVRVPLERKIAPWKDLRALFCLYGLFRRERADLVLSLMPKSGLLAMVAAFCAGVSQRIHFFTGQVWANKLGFKRLGLKLFDRLIALCATSLLTDGHAQRDFLVTEGVVPPEKISVLRHGSVGGVDCSRFVPNSGVRVRLRGELGIPDDAFVFLFLGRLNRDKGVLDLAQAFARVATNFPQAHLLIVGGDEANLFPRIVALTQNVAERVHRVGFTNRPEDAMAASDVLCLPSYREGFGSVVIEAASCGVPALVSDIYGLRDAVVADETGIFHDVGNVESLRLGMVRFLNDKTFFDGARAKGRDRVQKLFAQDALSEAMHDYIAQHIG